MAPAASHPDWSVAIEHLRQVDPTMGTLIDAVGPCTLVPSTAYYANLAHSIFAQQISTAVARALFGRFKDLFPRRTPTAKHTLTLTEEQLRSAGLSRQKLTYIRELAAHFADGRIDPKTFHAMEDEGIIEALTAVHGIGRWTAEMFLIFSLNRPDVFPVDDFGIKAAIRRAYGYKVLPKPRTMRRHAAAWAPYRTIGTWYLWWSGDLK